MKKLIIIFLSISLLLIVGCKKEKVKLCDSQNCEEYYDIWENLFKERNNISDDYFNEHILVTKTEINSWSDGESFNVNYTIKIDWAKIKNHDQFIIKINSSLYPSLSVSRTEYLSKTEVEQVLGAFAFSSFISKVNADNKLKFSTKRKALEALAEIASSNNIVFDRIYYKTQKPVFNANGHPFMAARGVINQSENLCIFGEIDLITGEGEAYEGSCW